MLFNKENIQLLNVVKLSLEDIYVLFIEQMFQRSEAVRKVWVKIEKYYDKLLVLSLYT